MTNTTSPELWDPNLIGNRDINATYGVPPRVSNLGNVPLTPGSGSSSTLVPPIEIQSEIDEEPNRRVKRVREHNANCWSIFKQVINPQTGVLEKGICLICGKEYVYKARTGTGAFIRHKESHEKKGETVPEELRSQMVQTQLGVGGGYFKYDPDKVRRGLIKYCIRSEKPLSMAMDPIFEEFVKDTLHPHYKKSYRKKATDDLFSMFWTKRSELYDEFKDAKYKVSITSDVWTAGAHDLAYCSVTAHWISEDTNFGTWILNKRILAQRVLPYPHNAQAIFEYVLGVLEEYNIRDKIFAVAFDNASNNNGAIRLLANTLHPIYEGAFFHTKCACHILNLIVHAGLAPKPIADLIGKYKEAIKFIDSSVKKKQSFAELCTRMNVPVVKIPWDIDTRWNSTYNFIKKTLPLKSAIDHALSRNATGQQFQLTFLEWQSVEMMVPFLECFYVATVRLSASYTPTASALLEELVTISDWYATQLLTLPDNSILRHAMEPIRQKFLKYWADVPNLTIIASCLDPRWKIHTTADLLITMKKNFGLEADNVHEQVKNLFKNVYKIYEQRYHEVRAAHGPSSASQPSNPAGRGRSAVSRVLSILNRQGGAPSSLTQQMNNTEIQLYISSISTTNVSPDDENFDVLQFWYKTKGMFPILASMAQDVFAAPVSTVASKSCFSAANRVLTDKRTRLGPDVFEALILLKDWFDAEGRLQDKSWMHIPPEPREVAGTFSSGPSQEAEIVSQPNEEQEQYGYNPYMHNYEDYGYNMYNQGWDY